MTYRKHNILALIFLASTFASAQNILQPEGLPLQPISALSEVAPAVLPIMPPEVALQEYGKRSAEQSARLAGYQDETVVTAELPETSQRGEYELIRTFNAEPRSLRFSSVKFTGDGFVKSNVITRVLQSEVDHVQKGDPKQTALSAENYKFYYKGTEDVNGTLTHVFQVKPRKKRPGLIKGKIYLDARTASLRRIEGSAAKSPSFFVRKLEFVQDFADVDGFTVPTVLKSVAKARIIGRTLFNIVHRSYQVRAAATPTVQLSETGSLK